MGPPALVRTLLSSLQSSQHRNGESCALEVILSYNRSGWTPRAFVYTVVTALFGALGALGALGLIPLCRHPTGGYPRCSGWAFRILFYIASSQHSGNLIFRVHLHEQTTFEQQGNEQTTQFTLLHYSEQYIGCLQNITTLNRIGFVEPRSFYLQSKIRSMMLRSCEYAIQTTLNDRGISIHNGVLLRQKYAPTPLRFPCQRRPFSNAQGKILERIASRRRRAAKKNTKGNRYTTKMTMTSQVPVPWMTVIGDCPDHLPALSTTPLADYPRQSRSPGCLDTTRRPRSLSGPYSWGSVRHIT